MIDGGNVFSALYQRGAIRVGEDVCTSPACLVEAHQYDVAHQSNLMCINYIHKPLTPNMTLIKLPFGSGPT